MTEPRQLELDGSLVPLVCVHRSSARARHTLLLTTGQVGTVEWCRCGHVRVTTLNLRGERDPSTWAATHAALPPSLKPPARR